LCCAVVSAQARSADDGLQPTIEQATQRVLKLYGARAGREAGYGSAVLVSADGYAVTTLSVLLEAYDLRAVAGDGRVFHPQVVARDPQRQLALLKLDAEDLPYFELDTAGSTDALPGSFVLTVGNPFKVAEGAEAVSVALGVVSQRTTLDARALRQDFPYRGPVLLLDTITANPGAAGGAVVDLGGQLVGMVGEIVESRRTGTRVNYCLPVEQLAEFFHQATEAGYQPASQPVARAVGYHGITLFTLGFRRSAAYVDRVAPGSPAEQAGLQTDDLILAVGPESVSDAASFHRQMERYAPGESVPLVVKRGQEVLTVELTLTEPPS
jgi:serine protease Do